MFKWLLKKKYSNYVNKLCDDYIKEYNETPLALREDPFFVINNLLIMRHMYFERLSIYNKTLYPTLGTKYLSEHARADLRAVIFFLICIEDELVRKSLKTDIPFTIDLEIIHEITFSRISIACSATYSDYVSYCQSFVRYLKNNNLL